MSDITSNFTDGNPLLASELNGWKDDRTGDLLPIAPVSGASPYNYTGSTYNLGSATYPWATLYSTQVVTPLLRIYSGATPVFQVDASGTLESFFNVSGKNFGIGTSTPSYKLDVIATAATSSEVKTVARFYSFYSGSPTSSFGGELLFTVLAPNGNPYDIVRLNFVNSSSGSGYGDLSIKMRHATDATNYEAFRIYGGTNSVKSFYTLYAQHTETTNNALGRSPLIVNSAHAGATANGFGTAIALSAMAQNGNEYVLGKIAAKLTGFPQANLEFWVRNTAGATYDGWDGMIRGGYFDYLGTLYLNYGLSVGENLSVTGNLTIGGGYMSTPTIGTDGAAPINFDCSFQSNGSITTYNYFLMNLAPTLTRTSGSIGSVNSLSYINFKSPTAYNGGGASSFFALNFDAALGTHLLTTSANKAGNTAAGTIKVKVDGVLYHLQLYADT